MCVILTLIQINTMFTPLKVDGIQEVSGSIPLIPTKNTAFHFEMRCFSKFLTIFVILGQQKSQQDQPFLSSDRRKDGSDGLHSGNSKRKENCLFQD